MYIQSVIDYCLYLTGHGWPEPIPDPLERGGTSWTIASYRLNTGQPFLVTFILYGQFRATNSPVHVFGRWEETGPGDKVVQGGRTNYS